MKGGVTMDVMDQFVKSASLQLNESEESTRAATASLLESLREQASKEDFDRLCSALPGVEALLHTHSADVLKKHQHGLAGALGWIRGWAGGTSRDVAFLAALQDAGFVEAQVAQFLNAFKYFASALAGRETVQKIFAEAPDLEILAQKQYA